jgi:hypothetical protein
MSPHLQNNQSKMDWRSSKCEAWSSNPSPTRKRQEATQRARRWGWECKPLAGGCLGRRRARAWREVLPQGFGGIFEQMLKYRGRTYKVVNPWQ